MLSSPLAKSLKLSPLRIVLFCSSVFLLSVLIVPAALRADNGPLATPEEIKTFLNRNIVWHKQLTTQQALITDPSDTVFFNDNRQFADQAIHLSFDFARVEAQALEARAAASHTSGNSEQATVEASRFQSLSEAAAKADQQAKQFDQDLASFRQQLTGASGAKRQVIASQIAETESQLNLLQVRRDTIRNMLTFMNGATGSSGAGGLRSDIEELARSVPALARSIEKQATASDAAPDSAPGSADAMDVTGRKETTGIFGLVSELLTERRKLAVLGQAIDRTNSLADAAKALRDPLSTRLRALVQRSNELAQQSASQDSSALTEERKELDGLTVEFKQLSSAILPLSKQNVLLDLYRHNATNWRNAVQTRHDSVLRSLLIRLSILAAVLGGIFGLSEIWRRVTFRYIGDARRRHQFLVLRGIVVGCVSIVVVLFSSVSGLGSITTFAGLLTAGAAVALQNVILAIAGYFFLIGKYGVRVGDRIQIAGVTGDVIDIGFIRLHMVEVSRTTGQRHTGRVVAFSNAVVFQPHAGLFKQVPGTNFVWHEVTLTVPQGGNYHQVEKQTLEAVTKVYMEYQSKMEAQYRNMEQTLSGSTRSLRPESRLKLTPAGLEISVRYPVELDSSVEIDDRVTREVLAATEQEPKLTAQMEARV
ncbi:MAG TPA: mechanosensitive ion channel domain-containing protein [Candidatus Angelobacter sp.]|nr:mechanosensitive ion channel domain-containing protein [Candidatus Angelobacter sp.]